MCPISSPLTLLFCFVNSRMANYDWARTLLGEFTSFYGCCPVKNHTSLGKKGWWAVSLPPLQYYLGQSSKKKATQVRSLIAMFLGVVHWAAVSKA